MKMIIRTDASLAIGTGHVMRCLTLADELVRRGHGVTFICRELESHLCDLISLRDYAIHRLPYGNGSTDPGEGPYQQWLAVPMALEMKQVVRFLSEGERADWLIADHYALDHTWHRAMRPYADNMMVVDDLANRRLDADLVLDQNLHIDGPSRYQSLVPSSCQQLLGPEYALLRSEFRQAREHLLARDGMIRRLLLFFGGSDPSNETMKGIRAFSCLKNMNIECDVVVGASNPFADEVRDACAGDSRLHFHSNVTNMAELMAGADLALGAPGTTTWERCCLGLPSLLIAIAENQESVGHNAHRAGIAKYLGVSQGVTVEALAAELGQLMAQPELVRKMSQECKRVVDGQGAIRVAQALEGIKSELSMTASDPCATQEM